MHIVGSTFSKAFPLLSPSFHSTARSTQRAPTSNQGSSLSRQYLLLLLREYYFVYEQYVRVDDG